MFSIDDCAVYQRSLTREEQDLWVDDIRLALRSAPLVRPRTPNGLPMRVRVSAAGKYGWVGDGAYRYDDKQKTGKPWPAIPDRWLELANDVAGQQSWDSAIINWYEPDASLGWHADESERDTSLPIVTISLGDACSWAIREREGTKIFRSRLESGAITVLRDKTRSWFHTVERIIPSPLFSPLKNRGRISVTLRVAG